MDKNTFSHYGWVIVAVIITSLLIAAAAPIANGAMVSINLIPDKLENAFGIGGSSDGAGVQPAYKLDTPTNLQLSEDDILTFNGGDYAEAYEITFKNGATSTTTSSEDTTVDLSSILSAHKGYAYIDVVATSMHPLYSNSDPATYIVGRVLSVPANITLSAERILSFDVVPHATGYVITLDGEGVCTITTNSLDLSEQLAGKSGTVVIGIQAIDNTNKYQNSIVAAYDALLGYTITISDGIKADYSYHSATGEVTLPYVSKDAYAFVGWDDGTTTHPARATLTVTQDTTFTAKWRKYPVVTLKDGETVIDRLYVYGTNVTLPYGPSKSGYEFIAWSDGSTTYRSGDRLYTTANVTLTAIYYKVEEITYTVTVKYNDTLNNVATVPVTGTNRDGVMFTTPTRGGLKKVTSGVETKYYVFDYWLVDGTIVQPGESILIYGNVTCEAVYSAQTTTCGECAINGDMFCTH